MIEAVGFDLDNTLVVTERDRESILTDVADQVGAPPLSRGAYLEAHGADLATETRAPIFEAILPAEADVSPETLARAYRDAVEATLVPIPDAVDLVKGLRESYAVGLLTDGPERAQTGKIEHLGWTDLFDEVVITGCLPAGKPAPAAFEALVEALGSSADRTAYVGDHPTADVQGAGDAGLIAIQVCYEGGPDPSSAADVVVDRDRLATELPSILDGLCHCRP